MAGHRGIAPIHPDIIPPAGAMPAGETHDGGRRVYRIRRKRALIGPKMMADGVTREHRINTVTGQQMYPLNEHKGNYDEEFLIVPRSEGNGNIRDDRYIPPTPEEIERKRRAKFAEERGKDILGALAATGLSPEEIIARLQGGTVPQAPPPTAPEPVLPEIPDEDALAEERRAVRSAMAEIPEV